MSARWCVEPYTPFQYNLPSCIFQFSFYPVYSMTHHPAEKKPHSLRFIDYIRMLPSSWVFEYFLKNNKARRKILSSTAIQEGVRHFSRAETVRRQFESLDQPERLKCSLTYLQGASGLPAALSGVDHLNDPLVRSFLVYAGLSTGGAVRYFGFPEFEPVLRPFCAKTIAEAGAVHGCLPDEPFTCRGAPAASRQLNDIAVMAVLALHGVLAKKKHGGLTGNALHMITELTHREQDNLLLYCGLLAGILTENADGYSLAADEFEAWLARPAEHRSSEMVRYAVRFAGSWSVELIRETLSFLGGTRMSCRIFPEKDRAEAVSALRGLEWAGIVHLSDAGGETVFGAARENAPAASATERGAVVVLPDFTAVIAQESSPEHLYGFGLIGTLQSFDHVYKGVVDRRILNDSLARGVQAEAVLGRLAAWKAPSNVVATVREWIREFHRLYITGCPVLVVADEKVAFEIGSYGPLRDCLEPEPAHVLFRIRPGAESTVRDILGNIGFDYRMPYSDSVGADKKTDAAAPDAPGETWEPIINVLKESPAPAPQLYGKKYGTGLKSLDLNETMHVIDYAILTGQKLMIDYGGTSLLRKGVYVMTPFSRTGGAEPLMEGALTGGRKKRIHVRKINRIGVVAS